MKYGEKKVVASVLVIILLLVIVLIVVPFSLEGCGSKDEAEQVSKTRLELWYYWDAPNARRCLADLVNEFNASEQELEIEVKYVPDEDFKKTLALAVADDEMPDLAIVDSVDVQYYNCMGTLKDVTECVAEDKYLELALASCRNKNGGYLGLPLGLNCLSFYYNTDMLRRAGVEVPETMNEFVEAARRLSTSTVYGCGFPALQSEESLYCFLPFLWGTGGSLDDISSEESVQAFQFLHQLVVDGSVSPSSVNMTSTDIVREFANERLAMVFAASGSEELIEEINPDIRFQVSGIPNGTPSISVIGGEVLVVTSQTHADEAERFLQFMSDPDHMRVYLDKIGYLSSRKDILEDQVQEDRSKQKYLTYLNNARTREFTPTWPAVSMLVSDVISQVILQESPPDALGRLAVEIKNVREEQYEKE